MHFNLLEKQRMWPTLIKFVVEIYCGLKIDVGYIINSCHDIYSKRSM